MPLTAAEFVAALCADKPVDFANATIDGDIDLKSLNYSHTLTLANATFTGHFDASDARFEGVVDLSGCTFHKGANLGGAHVNGRLSLAGAKFLANDKGRHAKFEQVQVEGNLEANFIQADALLNFDMAHVSGSLQLTGARVGDEQSPRDLSLRNVKVGGDLLAHSVKDHRTTVSGAVLMENADIDGHVRLSGASIGGRLGFENARIGGAIQCNIEGGHRTELKQGVSLLVSKVRQFELEGADVTGDVNLQGAEVEASLLLIAQELDSTHKASEATQFTRIAGNVLMKRAKVIGAAGFNGVEITGNLDMAGCTIGGGVYCVPVGEHRPWIDGGVWLTGARVAVGAWFSGAYIEKQLDLTNAEIIGNLTCRSERTTAGPTPQYFPTEVREAVSLNGARIAGTADFSGAQLGAFDMANSEVRVDFICQPDQKYRPEIASVWMSGAKVLGKFLLSGAKINGDLNLQHTDIVDCFCQASSEHALIVEGGVIFEQSRIGFLVLDGRVCTDPKAATNFTLAQIAELQIQNALPAKLYAEGLRFQKLELPRDRDHLPFLSRTAKFEKGTYLNMEAWLRNQGDDKGANRVYAAMRRRDRREGRMSVADRLLDWFLDLTIGYGLRSWQLLIYMVLVIALSTWLFSHERAVKRVVVVTATEAVSQKEAVRHNVYPEAPGDHTPLWTAIRVNIPLVALVAGSSWTPSSEPIAVQGRELPISYETYASIVQLIGWVVVPLFFAGVSGIVKKQ